MASTPGYQPRVRVNVGRADPVAGPNRALADGIADLGGAVRAVADDRREIAEARAASQYRIDAEQKRRDRSAMIADRAGAFAIDQGALQEELEEARKTVQPGAPDWPDRMKAIVDKRLSKFLDTLGDDEEVRQRFEPMIAEYGMRTMGRELDWARGKKAEHEGNGMKALSDALTVRAGDDLSVTAAFQQFDDILEGTDIDPTAKPVIRLEHRRRVVAEIMRRATEQGKFDQVREWLQSDDFKPYLTPGSAEDIRADVTRGEERKRVQEAQAAALAEREAQKVFEGVQAKIDEGLDPSPQELAAAREAVRLLDPKDQVKFASMQAQVAVNRETRGMDASDIRARRNLLRKEVASEKPSATAQLMLNAYERAVDRAEKVSADQFRGMLGEGPTGRIAIVEQLQGQDVEGRLRVGEDTEEGLGFAATLPAASSRRQAVIGADVRKSRKDLFDDKAEKAMRDAFRNNIGRVARSLTGGEYAGREKLAMDLYAADVARNGRREFNSKLFWEYQTIAFGATRRANGSFQGGLGTVNSRRIELPQEMTAAEFQSFLARSNWPTAVDSKGAAVAKSHILRNMVPNLEDISADGATYYYSMIGPNDTALKDREEREVLLPVPRRGMGAP